MNKQKTHRAQQLILKADRLNKQLYSRMGDKLRMHRSQHMVLMYISRSDLSVSQKEIAEAFEISPPAVAMLMKRLEKNGYIVRESSREDNRCNVITLTEKGKQVVEATKKLGEQCNSAAFAGFNEEEIDMFISFMEKVEENLQKFIADEEAKNL